MPGPSSQNIGARPERPETANRGFLRIPWTWIITLTAILLLAPALSAQQPKGTTLHGIVRDHAGKPLANAHVVLRGDNLPTPQDTTTDATGRFIFNEVETGAFTLIANSGNLRSTPVTVIVNTPGDQPPIHLLLETSGAKSSVSAPDASKAMQFADSPNFSIAAVTDWTAAGGHGSDSILRTSEALARQAVEMKSVSAQTTTTSPSGSGQEQKESESALRAAVAKEPNGFEANYRLGRFCLLAGHYQDAIPPLLTAYQAEPSNYDNEFDLAQALKMAGDDSQAREHVQRLLKRRPNADLHREEAELDETLGDPLSAVREFQEAASENPSEDNYFAWGSELLIHRAVWQAKEVFDEGVRLYPQSARMLAARGAALFAGALYDQAAFDLCKASDLNPESAEPYLFIGKIEIAAPDPLPCVVAKLARFQKLQPTNSLANYYYAMALWKQQGHAADPQTVHAVESMLTRAVTLDPKCAEGYFQLGNLSAGQKQWEQAIGLYQKAIQADPELSDAHYRLGIAYERLGEEAKAREQFQLHDAIAREQAAKIQRQRKAVKQFLVVLPSQSAGRQSHD